MVKHMLDRSRDLDHVYAALANPARRRITERLAEGPASVSQLAEPLSVTLAAVVQHVAVLEASGVVRTEKVGRRRICRLEPDALTLAEAWIHERRMSVDRALDRLGDLLAEDDR
jgi:DNA-binding transcriptional ArsR family regulator